MSNHEILSCVAAVVNYHHPAGPVRLGGSGVDALGFSIDEWAIRTGDAMHALYIYQALGREGNLISYEMNRTTLN